MPGTVLGSGAAYVNRTDGNAAPLSGHVLQDESKTKPETHSTMDSESVLWGKEQNQMMNGPGTGWNGAMVKAGSSRR